MDDLMKEIYRRDNELDRELVVLQTRHRMAKRELDQLDLAFGEVRTSRIAELRMAYANLMGRISDLINQNQMEKELYKGRHQKNG